MIIFEFSLYDSNKNTRLPKERHASYLASHSLLR